MAITVEPTPNPNACKFTVGRPVGGPATFTAESGTVDDPVAADLLGIDGVTSVFKTADFVTVTKDADASWDEIRPTATQILETAFS